MEVVEDEDKRLRGRELREQLADGAGDPVALVERRRRRIPRTGHRGQDLAELGPDGILEALDPPWIDPLDVLVERVDEDPERQILLELAACAGQDEVVATVRAFRQLGQQPGLADPRRADHLDGPRATLLERIERLVEERQLRGPSDKGHTGPSARRAYPLRRRSTDAEAMS
jgi:hypothetical protein